MRRAREAQEGGATEVCIQGGIHPDYTGDDLLGICRAVKAALPEMHVHAFSPQEVKQGAATLSSRVRGLPARAEGRRSRLAAGTSAEILDDGVRAQLPGQGQHRQWIDVMRTAHRSACPRPRRSCTATSNGRCHWARHLLRAAHAAGDTGGFTEFVPLSFVHMEAPMYLCGQARKGPTLREAVLMHAVARLALHPLIANIQTSWVKMGPRARRRASTPAPTTSAAR